MGGVFRLRLLPSDAIASCPNRTAEQPPHFAPLEPCPKLLPCFDLLRGMGPADVGLILTIECIGAFVDVRALLVMAVCRRNDPAARRE
jgi:hypothetical protein